MGNLIDTGILIAHERLRLDVRSLVRSFVGEDCLLSVITASELFHGIHRAKNPDIRARREEFVESVLRELTLVNVDLAIARQHAKAGAELEEKGKPIGNHDLWLAATCLALGHTLITTNIREFARVPGLSYKIWP
ncbi:MAG: type II toxin-antitoxin system VapC family toxin [Planctomycetes bacterium]|nr:type II toxin-antitoxin system VapC family toxin [Planctomycetota bacterium]